MANSTVSNRAKNIFFLLLTSFSPQLPVLLFPFFRREEAAVLLAISFPCFFCPHPFSPGDKTKKKEGPLPFVKGTRFTKHFGQKTKHFFKNYEIDLWHLGRSFPGELVFLKKCFGEFCTSIKGPLPTIEAPSLQEYCSALHFLPPSIQVSRGTNPSGERFYTSSSLFSNCGLAC